MEFDPVVICEMGLTTLLWPTGIVTKKAENLPKSIRLKIFWKPYLKKGRVGLRISRIMLVVIVALPT